MILVGSLLDESAATGDRTGAKRAGKGSDTGAANKLVAALEKSQSKAAKAWQTDLEKHESIVATAQRPKAGVSVYKEPGDKKPAQVVERREGQTGPFVFLVTKQKRRWLKVMLPIRPNGSEGWIKAKDVSLAVTDWRIEIELKRHRVSVFRGKELFVRESIGLGQPETPTPKGDFYLTELIKPIEKNTIYGKYVFVMSGFSEKLVEYAGGNGELGLHGTNDPSGLGNDVSHGCIRVHNRAITKLAEHLPLGTPVSVR